MCRCSPLAPAVSGYEDSAILRRLVDLCTIPVAVDPGHGSPSLSCRFKVNMEKSCLNPSPSLTFIGVDLDTVTMQACPSAQRLDDILQLLPLFRRGRSLAYILFLRLLGKLTAASTWTPSCTGTEKSGCHNSASPLYPHGGGGGQDLGSLRQGRGRSLCLEDVDPLPPMVLLDGEDQPFGSGCPGSFMTKVSSLCLSTPSSDPTNTSQSASTSHRLLLLLVGLPF